jgi:hypothetical protein
MRATTRVNAVRKFFAADTGEHVTVPLVEMYSCKEIIIIPDTAADGGHMYVDGYPLR